MGAAQEISTDLLTTSLKEVADEQALPLIDTTSLDPADPSNAALFLPRDGHLSEKGANAMAALISEQLVKNISISSQATFN